jgi:hypothetical protein
MNEKDKSVAGFSDENFLWHLALLCGTSHHLNDLNTKLQGQQKLISDMFGAVIDFEMKLNLFWKWLENVNL